MKFKNQSDRRYKVVTFSEITKNQVSDDGGQFGHGSINGFSVCTVGPALGHEEWCDEIFIDQVATQTNEAGTSGITARYSHGSMSGDGLDDMFGVATHAEGSDQQARANLHISEAADSERRRRVLAAARQMPERFGASIAFLPDWQASAEFALEHGATVDDDGYVNMSEFTSPDERNVENFPHVRLKQLDRIDLVGDPAANSAGLFNRDKKFAQFNTLFDYAMSSIGLDVNATPDEIKTLLAAININDPAKPQDFTRRKLIEHRALIEAYFAKLDRIALAANPKEEPKATSDSKTDSPDAEEIQRRRRMKLKAASLLPGL